MSFRIANRTWAAEVQLVAQLIANDFAWVSTQTCDCAVTVFCNHEWRYILNATNIHSEETTIDFIDSETVREADRLASSFRREAANRHHPVAEQHSGVAQGGHSDNGGI